MKTKLCALLVTAFAIPVAYAQEQKPANSFRQALASAYETHPQLKAEREALAAIDEGVAQAVSGFRPSVTGGFAYGRQRTSFGSLPWNYDNTQNRSLNVTQPVFSGGQTYYGVKAAKDRVKAGRAQLTAVEQQVLFDSVVAYTDVVEKQSVLKLNRSNVDVLSKQLEATKARFEVGELTRTDIAQAQARISQARSDERQAVGNLETARATFLRTIGYAPPKSLPLPAVPPILPQSLEEAIAWAQAANPQLTASRYTEKAARHDVDVRTGAILPEINVQANSTRNEGGNNFPGFDKYDDDRLTVNVNIPLYQSGAEWSRLRQAKNQAAQAKFNTYDTRDAVVENVTRAWEDFNTASSVIVSSREAVTAADLALEGVRQENEFGVRTILDVLNAEQEDFVSRVNLVRAKRAEKVQAFRLLAACGKLTAQNLGLSDTPYDPQEHYDDVKYLPIGF